MDFFELVATYVSFLGLALPLCLAWAAIETWLEEREGRRHE